MGLCWLVTYFLSAENSPFHALLCDVGTGTWVPIKRLLCCHTNYLRASGRQEEEIGDLIFFCFFVSISPDSRFSGVHLGMLPLKHRLLSSLTETSAWASCTFSGVWVKDRPWDPSSTLLIIGKLLPFSCQHCGW